MSYISPFFFVEVVDHLPLNNILSYGRENFKEMVLEAFDSDQRHLVYENLKPHFRAIQLFHELGCETYPDTFSDLFSRIGYLFKSKTDEALMLVKYDEEIASCVKSVDTLAENELYGRTLCHLLTESKIPGKNINDISDCKVDFQQGKIMFLLDPESQGLLKKIFSSAKIILNFDEITIIQFSDWLSILKNQVYAEKVLELSLGGNCDFYQMIALLPNLIKFTLSNFHFSIDINALLPLNKFKIIYLNNCNFSYEQVKTLVLQLPPRSDLHLMNCPQLTVEDLRSLQNLNNKAIIYS